MVGWLIQGSRQNRSFVSKKEHHGPMPNRVFVYLPYVCPTRLSITILVVCVVNSLCAMQCVCMYVCMCVCVVGGEGGGEGGGGGVRKKRFGSGDICG